VGGEKAREGVAAGEIAQFFERTEERDHLSRIVDPLREYSTPSASACLSSSRLYLRKRSWTPTRPSRRPGRTSRSGAAHSQADLDEQHLAHPVDAVPGIDMPQLMAQDDGQFGLRSHQGQDSPGDIDVASRNSEGVDDRSIQDGELVGELRPVRMGNKRLTDTLYVGIDLRSA